MKLLYTFAILLLVTACGTTVGVDYDRATDFSQYKTYNFYPSIDSGLSDLDDKRVMRITDSLLQQRGFAKSESPQLYINFFAKESISNSRNTLGIGIGGGGGNVGVGVSGGIPIGGRKMEQRLTVDVIDVAKDELIFQAVADGKYKEKITPAKKTQYYERVLSRLLDEFPPEK